MKHATLAIIFALASVAASATTLFFDNPTGTLGVSQSYGGFTTAYGFSNVSTPQKLYGKDLGNDEQGIGLSGFPDNEISGLGFIQILVSGLHGLSFEMNSTTDGEQWRVSQSNTLGVVGTLIMTGSDEGVFHAIALTMSYLTFQNMGTAGGANVLLEAINFESAGRNGDVPEPSAGWFAVSGLALILTAKCRQNVKR